MAGNKPKVLSRQGWREAAARLKEAMRPDKVLEARGRPACTAVGG
jgi:hypothetical protein